MDEPQRPGPQDQAGEPAAPPEVVPADGPTFEPPTPIDSEVLDRYERMYVFELERREDLTNRLQLQLGFLAACFTAIGFVLSKFHDFPEGPPAWFNWTLSAAIACSVPATGWFLAALAGKTYECMPGAHQLEEHRLKLQAMYAEWGEEGARWTMDFYRAHLLRYYADCGGKNALVNADRYQYIHKSLQWTVTAGVLAGLAGLMQWFALSGSTA